MRILVLGGTVFLGRAVVEAACAAGHDVTLFNRGTSNADLFPNVETLHGDRDGGLDILRGRHFDACLDTCGYLPRLVKASVELLSKSVKRYAFVSSVSVYDSPSPEGTDETGNLATLDDTTVEEITGETYGPLKALCEAEVSAVYGNRVLLIRPGLIVGPHDPTDRFTYWPWRGRQGGQILAPGRKERAIQFIDVRDLAAWIVRMLEQGTTGAFNASSSPGDITMGDLLRECSRSSAEASDLVWVSDAFLVEKNVGAWMELPLWIPEDEPIARGFFDFRSDRAIKHGLTFRPLDETVRNTAAWAATRPEGHAWKGGLSYAREAELLAEWLRRA